MADAAPPFFIVGSARSGTTLLRLMLNAHRDIAVPPESRFITELWQGQEMVDVEGLLGRLAAHKRFEAWDLPLEAVREELGKIGSADYASVIEAAYKAYARVHGKTSWGDKTPRYVESIPFIARLWPASRFIHLIRDGRNVALSYADVPFGPKNVAQAAQLWATRVGKGCTDGRALDRGRYIEIRYEDLVEDAAGEAKDLCEFLGIEFDPGMLDYTERARDAMLTRASQYNPHLTEKPVANTRSWAEEMPRTQIEIFEAVAGDVLKSLGYERRFDPPGPAARIKAMLGKLGLPIGRL